MTEKRFIVKHERTLVDNKRGRNYVFSWASDAKEVCYLLNQFNDYDELLKRGKECYKSRWKNQLKANGRLVEENEQLKQKVSKLKEDNDHKFWKLQFMHQFNTTELIVHEIGRAIEQGYEVSDKFQEYLNELKEHNEKGKEKAIEQEKW